MNWLILEKADYENLRIAVVDDFQKDRDNLALQLEAYIRDNGLEGEI